MSINIHLDVGSIHCLLHSCMSDMQYHWCYMLHMTNDMQHRNNHHNPTHTPLQDNQPHIQLNLFSCSIFGKYYLGLHHNLYTLGRKRHHKANILQDIPHKNLLLYLRSRHLGMLTSNYLQHFRRSNQLHIPMILYNSMLLSSKPDIEVHIVDIQIVYQDQCIVPQDTQQNILYNQSPYRIWKSLQMMLYMYHNHILQHQYMLHSPMHIANINQFLNPHTDHLDSFAHKY